MLVYFAHPIDQADNDRDPFSVIAASRALAEKAGVNLYRPGTAFGLTETDRRTLLAVDQVNRAALSVCAALVAVLPSGMPTLGTPLEIERALAMGKPTVIICDMALQTGSVQIRSWQDQGATLFDPFNPPEALEIAAALRRPPTSVAARQIVGELTTFEGHLQQVQADPGALTMLWKRTAVNAAEPTRAYPDDAGFDLAAIEDTLILAGSWAAVKTGVAFALPHGHWGMITGRSSTWHKRGLMTIPGVIDHGWRGELLVTLYNPTEEHAQIAAGERIGQFIPLPAWSGRLEHAASLPDHDRGLNGFGSSGV